ncbi:MAG: hypothetical protein N3F66_01060 [Spirochaetes bacterium]|nr:hypothetical protein [Spirochaetota bacterium]
MSIENKTQRFPFVQGLLAKESYVYDILAEIVRMQELSLPDGKREMATLPSLQASRNIPIPFTTSRNNQINYLITQLLNSYPDHVKKLITFSFTVDEKTKKLDIYEKEEYCVDIHEEEFNRIQLMRDEISKQNLLTLLKQYRLFNLSKLIKKSINKNDLNRIIKSELGNTIFTFKHFTIDKNHIELAEDYCFHADNYQAVKSTINFKALKNIITQHADMILRRLKKFGIISYDFSDYRDAKLDYIFTVLLDDMASLLPESDLAEVKNLQAFRNCLLKVDSLLDPVDAYNNDIVSFIREHKLCSQDDIINTIPEIDESLMEKWRESNYKKNAKILVFNDSENNKWYYIDGPVFINYISDCNQLLFYQNERYEKLSYIEKEKLKNNYEILIKIAETLITENNDEFALNHEQKEILQKILDDYNLKKKPEKSAAQIPASKEIKQKKSLLARIIEVIFSLFKRKKIIKPITQTHVYSSPVHQLSKQARNLYDTISSINKNIIALSEVMDITDENESEVSEIIDELRDTGLKIVIPIYNARKVLYPRRSQKLLIPDIEYILVSPVVIRSYDAIKEFCDSLIGKKLNGEIIPSSGIIAIEKYLHTLYRQKRNIMMKK